MRWRPFLCALAVLLSCSAPAASPSATPTAIVAPSESATASPTAAIVLRDLSVVWAGEPRGDHALVLVFENDGGPYGGGSNQVWDVPLDGTAPRSVVAYTRAERPLSGYFGADLSRQLSPDGRQLVLSDPVDVAGRGLVVIDLVTGAKRVIPTPDVADQVSWSPDGQRIAYRGFALQGPLQKESGLWVVRASGGAPQQFWPSGRAAGTGATMIWGWTEDGAGIAITQDSSDVSVVDVASGSLKRISGPVHGIAWRAKRPSVVIGEDQDVPLPSPTGPRGAPGNVGRPGQVVLRDTTFAAPQIVYRHDDVGTLLWGPRWNPKTDEVLFYWVCGAGAAGRFEFVLVNAVTRAVRTLATPSCVYSTAWSGDGSQILYSDIFSVRAMKANGTSDRELFRPSRGQSGVQPSIGGIVAFGSR
jgi:Tol biopolymer transport system component